MSNNPKTRQPTAIMTHCPAVLPQHIAARLDALRLADENASLRYTDAKHALQARCPEVTDDWIDNMETRNWIGNSALHGLYGHWLVAKRARAELKLYEDSPPKPRLASVNIAVIHGFDLRDTLKKQGYRFLMDGWWHDPVGLQTTPAWCKTIPPDDEDAERKWLTAAAVELVDAK